MPARALALLLLSRQLFPAARREHLPCTARLRLRPLLLTLVLLRGMVVLDRMASTPTLRRPWPSLILLQLGRKVARKQRRSAAAPWRSGARPGSRRPPRAAACARLALLGPHKRLAGRQAAGRSKQGRGAAQAAPARAGPRASASRSESRADGAGPAPLHMGRCPPSLPCLLPRLCLSQQRSQPLHEGPGAVRSGMQGAAARRGPHWPHPLPCCHAAKSEPVEGLLRAGALGRSGNAICGVTRAREGA